MRETSLIAGLIAGLAIPLGLAAALAAGTAAAQTAAAVSQTIPLFGPLQAAAAAGGPSAARSAGGGLSLDLAAFRSAAPAGEDAAIPLLGPRLALAAPPEPAAAEPEVRHPVAALWPLDVSRVAGGRAQFRGEREVAEFVLVVPPGRAPDALVVAAVSSAFIMPGRSVLRAYAGDTLLGEMPLASITSLEEARFPLRPGQLAPGFNRIRLETELAHRLYCGAEASYDLWTSVDLSASGVAYVAEAVTPGPDAFLAAASVARGAGLPLLVRGADPARGPEQIGPIGRQLAGLMGGGLAFTAEAAPASSGGLPAPAIELQAAGSPGVRFRAEPDGRQVMVVTGAGGTLPPLFVAATGAAATAVPELPQDSVVPLSALGFGTVQIAENLWRDSVDFRLPADWLVTVRKRAVLELAYAHLPGLPVGSELRVLVNGDVVRIIPLDRGGRLDALPLEVRFDAGLLQAGRNVLGFEVNVPGDPADQPCPAVDLGRIEIGGDSTLVVPSSPAMHLPGLARWMTAGGAPRVEVASPGGGLEAWDVVPRLAAALRTSDAAGAMERRLVVLRTAELSRAAFGDFAVGRQVMLAALQPPQAPRPRAASAEPGLAGQAGLATAGLSLPAEAASPLSALRAAVAGLGERAWTGLARLARPDPVSDLGDWLSERRGQAILFQLDPEAPGDLHLLLADDARMPEVVTALETVARHGAPLTGHVALLGRDGGWQTWTDTTRLPVLEEPLTERNWRGVIGNFASARPIAFVGLVFAIAALSVLVANSYVAASRKQR